MAKLKSAADAQPAPKAYRKNSLIFLLLSLAAAAINYAYYPAIAHFLSPSQFGAIQSLIAILLQVGAIFSGLNLVTIYLVNKLDDAAANRAIEIIQKTTTSLFILATLAVTVAQNSLLNFLHIDNRTYILIVSLDLITSIPFVIAFGHLQARRRFVEAGLLQITVVSIKLILGVLATKSFGPAGALLGIALGQVLGMVVFWIASHFLNIKLWSHRVTAALVPPSFSELRLIAPISINVLAIFAVNVLAAIFISFDIIAARHFFRPGVSGLYSGASTISNAIVFVCLPLISVLLPHLDRKSLASSMRLLVRTGSVVAAISVLSVLFFKLFPGPLLRIFGESYASLGYLLWRLGILMSLVAGITLVYQTGAFYAPRRTALLSLGGAIMLITVVARHHGSLINFVSAIMLAFSIMLFIGILQIIWIYRSGYRKEV